MIAVISENYLNYGQEQVFKDTTASILPLIEQIDGFISVERFVSLSEPGKILSLSFWRDEEAVAALRHLEAHRSAEVQGRARLLKDFRVRVAAVVRDYGMFDREQAPLDSRQFHSEV